MKTNDKTNITFDTIGVGKLFFLPNCGVCRKTGAMTAEDKRKQERVVYPNDVVSELRHAKKE